MITPILHKSWKSDKDGLKEPMLKYICNMIDQETRAISLSVELKYTTGKNMNSDPNEPGLNN